MRIDGRLYPISFSKANNQNYASQNNFSNFVNNDFSQPKIPLNVSKAYASSQLYPEYKVLETFKQPNTDLCSCWLG